MATPGISDLVIVGGAAVGASAGWHAKRLLPANATVTIVERDPTFAHAATTLSAASIRQQFSTPENIALSLYGLDVLRDLATGDQGLDPGFVEGGYLVLAPTGAGEALARNHAVQIEHGADNVLLDRAELAERFGWISTEGLDAGCLGLSGEGWFDAHTFLRALRRRARESGAMLLAGEVTAIETHGDTARAVRLADGSRIACGTLVNAAGPSAGRLAALAGQELPVEPRKRTVFVVDCPGAPDDLPLIADPSGVWLRREGRTCLTGYSPPASRDGPCDPTDFEPDHDLFEETIWPALANRIPAFETLKVLSAWAGHYDYNVLDQNAIIGPDVTMSNLLYANGFSGHGLQHAAGAGRAVAEWIVHGEYRSIDVSRLGHGRIVAGRPLFESNVI